jgi:hypothetical protein
MQPKIFNQTRLLANLMTKGVSKSLTRSAVQKYLTLSVRGKSPALGGSRQKSGGIKSPRNRLGASFRLNYRYAEC